MDLGKMIAQHLENQARQQLLNQALYHIIDQTEDKSVVVPFSVLEDGGNMGGVSVEVNYEEKTVTLKTVTMEAAEAMVESFHEEHH